MLTQEQLIWKQETTASLWWQKKEKENLYNEARAFYELAECGRINIPEKKNVESFIPYIVNMTFATELYLKLLLIDNGKSISEVVKLGHKLSDLYEALNQAQKDTIYQAFKRPLVFSIPDELKKINTAFVDWRYLVLNKANNYQRRNQFSPYFIKEFNEILETMCKLII